MLSLALALYLAAQPAAAEGAKADAPAPAPAAASDAPNASPADAPPADGPIPPGAPHEDYQFVAWCYGALRGYVDLHDQVMPEVTRIESEFQRPGTTLAEDLKTYADAQKQARTDLKLYRSAMTAAEQASIRPINTLGAAAVSKGQAMWTPGPTVTKAQLAQVWMSWEPPPRCARTAKALRARAVLMGPAFKLNDDAAPTPPATDGATAPTQPAAPAMPAEAKPADPAPAAEATDADKAAEKPN